VCHSYDENPHAWEYVHTLSREDPLWIGKIYALEQQSMEKAGDDLKP